MFLRLLTKQRLFVGFVILVAIVSLLYYNLIFKQQSNGTGQWSGDRCLTELTSIKYQLNGNYRLHFTEFVYFEVYFLLFSIILFFTVVTEYKNRIDKLLTENEKQHKLDKERFKEIMESCFAMKQQSLLCQVELNFINGSEIPL